MKKLNIIWVDRNPEDITNLIEIFDIHKLADISIFTKFKFAQDAIKDSSETIDFVISTYQTTTIRDLGFLASNPDLNISVYDFYDTVVNPANTEPKFILFSSLADLDSRTFQYEKKENFKFIKKDCPETLYSELKFKHFGLNMNRNIDMSFSDLLI